MQPTACPPTLRAPPRCSVTRDRGVLRGAAPYRLAAQQRARLTSERVNAAGQGLPHLSAPVTGGPGPDPTKLKRRQPAAAPPSPPTQNPQEAALVLSEPDFPPQLPYDGRNRDGGDGGAPAAPPGRQRRHPHAHRPPDQPDATTPQGEQHQKQRPLAQKRHRRQPRPRAQSQLQLQLQPPPQPESHILDSSATLQVASYDSPARARARASSSASQVTSVLQPRGHGAPRQPREEGQANPQPQPQPQRQSPRQSRPQGAGALAQDQDQDQAAALASNHFAAPFPRHVAGRSRRRSPKQLTAALYGSSSLLHLLAQLEVCGPLNAIQLCAAFAAAEHIVARESGGGGGGSPDLDPGPRQPGTTTGLLAPPCRALTRREAAALAAVLAAHREVLADANPPELATTLWAAARLRLRLPPAVLEPALEAIWMWDPADPTVNRQTDRSQRSTTAEGGGAAGAPVATRRDVMGPWEVCLLLYAASVLWPEYVRQNAGGFLEALDSYETGAASAGEGPQLKWPRVGGGGVGGWGGRRRRGELSGEQVVAVVAALARADAPLDEVEEDFVLQAVSFRLHTLALPQLTSLLSSARAWAPLRRSLHGDLLAALLASLEREHAAFMAARRMERERPRTAATAATAPARRQEQEPDLGGRQQWAGQLQSVGGGSAAAAAGVSPSPPAATPAGAAAASVGADFTVARALVAALRGCVDPVSRQPLLRSRELSGLMRQVRLRAGAGAFGARDVCEALRAMAALAAAPAAHPEMVVRWKEGVRGLLRAWVGLLRKEAEAPEKKADADPDADPDADLGRAAAARTFATTLHAVSRLGVRLQRAESEVAAAAAVALAPYMAHMADCVMVLSALADTLAAEAATEAEAVRPRAAEAAEAAEANGDDGAVEAAEAAEAELGTEAATDAAAAAKEEEEVEGAEGDWRWLRGGGVRRLSERGRRAAQLVLERAAVLLERQQAQRPEDGGGGGGHGGAAAGPGELVCLIRAVASIGAWPPERWWRAWREAVVAALPPALRPAAGARPAPAVAASATYFSLTEAVDVLYSLARLEHLRSRSVRRADSRATRPVAPVTAAAAAQRRWRRRRGRLWSLVGSGQARVDAAAGVSGPSAEGNTKTGFAAPAAAAAVDPVDGELLTALLTVACLGPAQPRRSQSTITAAAAAAAAGEAAGREVGPMSVYFLTWAVARLRLFGPREAALWGPRLAAAAPRALVRLTPRKQVLMLRSLTWALRGAAAAASRPEAAPLPPQLAAAWLAAFRASLRRARGQTLSYAAAAVAAARITPPAEWLVQFRAAVRGRVSELSVREMAALVAGLRLHRPQPQLQPQQAVWQTQLQPAWQWQQPGHRHRSGPAAGLGMGLWRQPLPYDDEWGNAGLARALLRVLRRKLVAASPSAPRPLGATAGSGPPRPASAAPGAGPERADPATATAVPAAIPGPAPAQRPEPQPQLQLSEEDRQLSRRLCFLLSRGAAARAPGRLPPSPPPPPKQQPPQGSGPGTKIMALGAAAMEGAASQTEEEEDEEARAGRECSRSDSDGNRRDSGSDSDSGSRGGSDSHHHTSSGSHNGGGGGGAGVPLAPRPLLRIRRGDWEGRAFRLP